MTKHHLIEDKGIDRKDVKIFWDEGFVKVRFRKVAWHLDGTDFQTAGEANDIKDTVEENMKIWRKK